MRPDWRERALIAALVVVLAIWAAFVVRNLIEAF